MLGLTGDGEDCPYKLDSSATREYQAISGCSDSVPTENGGGEGTKCGHFDEACLQHELMTGFASGGLPMSRITVGTLEDLGYEVDYSKADLFGQSELADECVCNADRKLGTNDNFNRRMLKAKPPQHQKRRKLSAQGRAIATEYGRAHLASMKLSTSSLSSWRTPNGQELQYVGDRSVHVLYHENGHIHGVHVVAGP